MAMLDTVATGTTPVITLASSARLIEPVDDKRRWGVKTPHSDSLMAEGIARHAAANGVKKLAFVGFNNALGETFWVEIEKAAKKHGIEVVGKESFAPTDTSAVAQTLKLIGAAPDAVVVGASGTPAAMPARDLRARGFKGKIYFTHGVANTDFLRVGGTACEGAGGPGGPVMVADLLPDNNPVKATAQAFAKKYEAANGAGSVSLFAAYTRDVGLLLQQAIPVAVKTAKPGTPEFRAALRDALAAHLELDHEVLGGHSGLHLTVRLPPAFSDVAIVEQARKLGMNPGALAAFAITPRPEDNGLVSGYGNTGAERFPALVGRRRDIALKARR
ncbi:hypothetical protein G6F31_014220 [Rhizopus arrhizus]|nr:hypothetical protein G6F31_014220 [Rhizopus arrhizus]